jgi:hypothetical protein
LLSAPPPPRWREDSGPAPGRPAPGNASAAPSGAGDCIAHHPNSNSEYDIWYAQGCTGHDEPELDPVSSLPGSAQDLTWTAVLPSDGAVPVSAVGPTFWWGGTVTDPNPHALFGQAFLEVQFYPDAIVNNCSSAGGFNVTYAPDKFSVCTPVWQVGAFNGADYPGTRDDYGQAGQFATTPQCSGPFGPDSTYCDTMLNPTP